MEALWSVAAAAADDDDDEGGQKWVDNRLQNIPNFQQLYIVSHILLVDCPSYMYAL